MTNGFDISRRKVLAGLGTIGVASAGAGLGTTAFFSDEESLEGSLEAGRVDLLLDYRSTYVPWDRETPFATMSGSDGEQSDIDRVPGTDYDGDGTDDRFVLDQRPNLRDDGLPYSEDEWGETTLDLPCDFGEAIIDLVAENDTNDNYLVDGFTPVVIDLADVKPRDTGEITTSLHLCDNRAFLWMRASVDTDLDNGVVEPEAQATGAYDGNETVQIDGDEARGLGSEGVGELDDYLHVRVFHDDNCNNVYDEAEDDVIFEGSLAAFAEFAADGIALDGDRSTGEIDCFSARTEEGFGGAQDLAGAVHCVAMEWYLPCMNFDDPNGQPLPTPGFSELPSDAPGALTLADELDAKGLPYEDFDAINVVQTDSLSFTLQYYAVQCRHNTTNVNPFTGESTDGGDGEGPAPSENVVGTTASFDTDLDGWTATNDGVASYQSTGGNPGGYILGEDTAQGSWYYFAAPSSFLGDKSAAAGGALMYDLLVSEVSSPSSGGDTDVVMSDGTTTLYYDVTFGNGTSVPTVGTWQEVAVDLSTGWTVGSPGGTVATPSEIATVLSNLTTLEIRGEYSNQGNDTACLDNVRFVEPTSP